ncbi:hypothetical protein Q604_UNBc4C00001G0001, partial [human gut metagenome]
MMYRIYFFVKNWVMILIKNGRLVDPLSKRDEVVDIVIEKDKIKEIGKNL